MNITKDKDSDIDKIKNLLKIFVVSEKIKILVEIYMGENILIRDSNLDVEEAHLYNETMIKIKYIVGEQKDLLKDIINTYKYDELYINLHTHFNKYIYLYVPLLIVCIVIPLYIPLIAICFIFIMIAAYREGIQINKDNISVMILISLLPGINLIAIIYLFTTVFGLTKIKNIKFK